MALFDWFSSAKKKSRKSEAAPISSGLSRMESTRPVQPRRGGSAAPEPAPGQPANRKHERMARRELLYSVVRECMANAGVVSATYKFKVLSLDARGRQFLVMVDLSSEYASDTGRLAEIEAMVAQAAKMRHDIVVTAVYWRTSEHVAVGMSAGRHPPLVTPSRPAPLISAPTPLSATPSRPAPLAPSSRPMPLQSGSTVPAPSMGPGGRYEPLHPTEVEAFKQALASGASGAQALRQAGGATDFDGAPKHGPQNYTLLTGFEDTEMAENEAPHGQALSATQYGDLR